jgi:glycosyltransferase involved in cell wall biosynthesis
MASTDSTINILWVMDHLGYESAIHGAGMYARNVISAFDPNLVQIHVGILRQNSDLEKNLKHIRSVDFHSIARRKYDPCSIFDFFSIIRRKKIKIIHSHGYKSDNFGRIAGKITGIPAIVHTHDPLRYYPLIQWAADRLLSGATDFSIAVSSSVKEIVTRKRKIAPEKTAVFPTCIIPEHFPPLSRREAALVRDVLEIPPGWNAIGTLGRLHPQKGVEFLLKAAPAVLEQFPATIFFIVGDGPLKKELADLSHLLGLSPRNVRFIGFQQEVRLLLGVLDVVALPSLWEGTPVAMLEAMAMGRPIVATRVDGMKEVLEHQRTALLVPPGNPQPLAAGICRLLADRRLAARIGAAASLASRKYDARIAAEQLQRLYLDLVR